jgi:hypothetical protein
VKVVWLGGKQVWSDKVTKGSEESALNRALAHDPVYL